MPKSYQRNNQFDKRKQDYFLGLSFVITQYEIERRPMIFIVDDDKDDLELITNAFEESKFYQEIKLFNNAKELINLISNAENKCQPPHYIITDLKMPGMDGIAMVEAIRQLPEYKFIPIIMLSTSNLMYDMERGYKYGVNCYLIKPDTYSGWKSTIETIRIWIDRWYQAVTA